MKRKLLFFFLLTYYVIAAQTTDPRIPQSSLFYNLMEHDTVVFYQCHVEDAVQQLTTASGQTLTGTPQKYTITEKYVISKSDSLYNVRYYTTALSVFPNKKFSGLKIRERPYWAFKKVKDTTLTSGQMRVMLALERKGREAIEFDYGITKYTTNQVIIRRKKNFKQLVIDGNYVASKLLAIY